MLGRFLRTVFPKRNRVYNSSYRGAITTGSTTAPCPGYVINMATTGLSVDVLGRFIVDGIPVLRIRIFGTATATAQAFFSPSLPSSNIQAPANPGQTWVSSVYCALVAGTIPMALTHQIQGASLADGFVEQSSVSVAGMTSVLRRFQIAKQLATATVAKVRWSLVFGNFTSASSYDFTIDVGGIQLEKRPFASAWEPT